MTFEEVYNDLMQRDKNDSTRAASPLKKADDAIVLDTTNLNLEQVVDEAIRIINRK